MVAALVRLASASEADEEAAEEEEAGGIDRAMPGMGVRKHGPSTRLARLWRVLLRPHR